MPLRKKNKNIIILVLIFLLALVLCACGNNSDIQNTEAQSDEMPPCSYSADFTRIDNEIGTFKPVCFNGKGWYAISLQKKGENIPQSVIDEASRKNEAIENDGRYDVYERELWFISKDASIRQLEEYAQVNEEKIPGNWSDFGCVSNFGGMCIDENGLLFTIEYSNISGIDTTPEIGGNSFKTVWYLRTLDPESGLEQRKIVIENEDTAFLKADSMIYRDGRILFLAETEDGIFLYSITKDGIISQSVKCSGYATKLITLSNDNVAVCSYENDYVIIQALNDDTFSLETVAESSDGLDCIFNGFGEYSFLYSCGWKLFGFNIDVDSDKMIISWPEIGISSTDVLSDIESDDNGDFIFLTKSSIVRLSAGEDATDGTKTELELLCCYPSQTLRKTVADFNAENNGTVIKLVDYSAFCTGDNYEIGLYNCLKNFSSDNMPDILDLSNLNYRRLAANGLFVDLFPYIDSDFGRQNYFQSVFNALEVGGKMCSTCAGFSIETVIGPSRLVGNGIGWTYNDYYSVKSTIGGGCSMFEASMTPETVFKDCLLLNIDSYVDWENGTCNFDNQSFKDLVEFADSFNDENRSSESTDIRIYNGQQILLKTQILNMEDALRAGFEFKEDVSFPGFPSESGTGNSFLVSSLESGENFAILSGSNKKDVAWNFLRTFFTPEYQKSYRFFPTSIQVFNSQLEETMKVYYVVDEYGEAVLDKKTGEPLEMAKGTMYLSDYTAIKYYAMTQDRAYKLVELINSTKNTNGNSGNDMIRLICSLVNEVFSGRISEEYAAQAVQTVITDYIISAEHQNE